MAIILIINSTGDKTTVSGCTLHRLACGGVNTLISQERIVYIDVLMQKRWEGGRESEI